MSVKILRMKLLKNSILLFKKTIWCRQLETFALTENSVFQRMQLFLKTQFYIKFKIQASWMFWLPLFILSQFTAELL
jgi:hypothetical protein